MPVLGLVGVAVALALSGPSYFARMARRLARRAASMSSIGVVGRSSSISTAGAGTGNGMD